MVSPTGNGAVLPTDIAVVVARLDARGGLVYRKTTVESPQGLAAPCKVAGKVSVAPGSRRAGILRQKAAVFGDRGGTRGSVLSHSQRCPAVQPFRYI